MEERPAAELALPEAAGSRLRFDRAARSFRSACFIHDEARRRLLERLDGLRIETGTFVDLGSALGQGAVELRARYPEARILALDASREMLKRSESDASTRLVGDAARLPFPDRSISLLFANMVLPWTRPDSLFAEARRVLKASGVLVFSTLGPDTLQELRRAWLRTDDSVHVHGFFDAQTLGDLAVRSGLEEPVLDVDRITVCYQELSGVIRDLRACGATNVAGGRRRGLTGRGRWQRFVEALWRDQGEGQRGRLNLTVELILGQAFGSSSGSTVTKTGEVVVPLEELGRPADG
ncbi:MAG TPA: methyltransferase domain-containing protein [Gammaproteobacteria bacterium]